tara:strand:+ start:680 stop:1138 length:459 start_codon:yes stop_codon:yes gene_type:complete
MNFYLKVENNQIVGDLLLESNLKRTFPTHDWLSGLPPSGYVICEVTEAPLLGVYEKWDELFPTHFYYQLLSDKTAKRVWAILPLSDVEKKERQDAVKKAWADENAANDKTGYEDWYFDETYCCYLPPSGMPPNDGKDYVWDTTDKIWKEKTE